jgi:type IX secretion system PorP/SprF family membrane protein
MKKLTTILFSVLCLAKISGAQDVHLSQFNSAPILLNAANTGSFDGKIRVAANYRNQWASVATPYQTSVLSADAPLCTSTKYFFGVGILGIYDKAGSASLTHKTAMGSAAFHYAIGKSDTPKHYIHIGVQAGFTNITIDASKLIFASQYNPATHSYTLPSGTDINDNVSYFDMNFGASWSSVISKRFSFITGLSLHHINQPKVKDMVFTGSTKLKTSTVFSIQTPYKISNKTTITPAIYLMQQSAASETTLGSNVNYKLKSVELIGGAYYRLQDAAIVLVGVQAKNIRVGLSYDFTTSNLKAGSKYKGGFEVSLAYCPFHQNKKLVFYPKN